MDFRPGGTLPLRRARAGRHDYAFRGEYREIVAPERIVQTFEFEGMPGHVCRGDAGSSPSEDGKTKVTSTTVFDSVEERDGMLDSGMEPGASESYDALAAYLTKLS